jgi:hypothetical protein
LTGVLSQLIGLVLSAFDFWSWIPWVVFAGLALLYSLGAAMRDAIIERDTPRRHHAAEVGEVQASLDALREEVQKRDEREDVALSVRALIPPEEIAPGIRKLSLKVLNEGATSTFATEIISEIKGVWLPIPEYGPGIDVAWEGRWEQERGIASRTPDYLVLAEYNTRARVLALISPASIYTGEKRQQKGAGLLLIGDKVEFWVAIMDVEVNVARRFYVLIQVSDAENAVPAVIVWPEDRAPDAADAPP